MHGVSAVAAGNAVGYRVDAGADARDGVIRPVTSEHGCVVTGIAGLGAAPDDIIAAAAFHGVVAAIAPNGVGKVGTHEMVERTYVHIRHVRSQIDVDVSRVGYATG